MRPQLNNRKVAVFFYRFENITKTTKILHTQLFDIEIV